MCGSGKPSLRADSGQQRTLVGVNIGTQNRTCRRLAQRRTDEQTFYVLDCESAAKYAPAETRCPQDANQVRAMMRAAILVVSIALATSCSRTETTRQTAERDVSPVDVASAPDPAAIARAAARANIERGRVLEQALSDRMLLPASQCARGPAGAPRIEDKDVRELIESACAARGDGDPSLWRLAVLATAPAVRQLPSPPPRDLTVGEVFQQVRFSAASGIVLLLGPRYRFVDLLTGEEAFFENNSFGGVGPISDNGRLYFHTGRDQMTWVRSTVTGERLYQLPDARDASEASWLGSDAVLYNTRSSSARILDLEWGTDFEVMKGEGPVRGVPAPVSRLGGREYMILGPSRILQIGLPATKRGMLQTPTDWTIPRRTWSGDARALTLDGRYFVDSGRHLTVFDFQKNEKEEFSFAPFVFQRALPGLAPEELFLQLYPYSGGQSRLFVFHMKEKTLAEVDSKAVPVAGLEMARPYGQLAAIKGNALVFYPSIPVGERLPFETVVANLEKAQKAAAPKAMPERPLGVAAMPGPLAELAKSASIEAIGVNSSGVDATGRYNGIIRVDVRRSSRPLILVLTAFSSTRWQLMLDPGAEVAAVLTSGYEPQTVVGAGNARILNLGETFVYERDKLQELERSVFEVTGRRIDLFQGRYTGNRFVVGGS